MGSDTRDLHGAVDDIDEEQNVVCHQSPDRADLDREKICRHQAFPMSSKKRRPRHVLISLRGRIDVARHLGLPDLTKTSIGAAVGTPAYFAPEQWEGSRRDIDHRRDLFAAGILLYQALLGRHPFLTNNL